MNNDIIVTNELCDCGNDFKMKGWRVCLACAEARLIDPDTWAELDPRPDKLDEPDGVPLEAVYADIRAWL